MSRTLSTSLIHREVIHAQGHSGSNQNRAVVFSVVIPAAYWRMASPRGCGVDSQGLSQRQDFPSLCRSSGREVVVSWELAFAPAHIGQGGRRQRLNVVGTAVVPDRRGEAVAPVPAEAVVPDHTEEAAPGDAGAAVPVAVSREAVVAVLDRTPAPGPAAASVRDGVVAAHTGPVVPDGDARAQAAPDRDVGRRAEPVVPRMSPAVAPAWAVECPARGPEDIPVGPLNAVAPNAVRRVAPNAVPRPEQGRARREGPCEPAPTGAG